MNVSLDQLEAELKKRQVSKILDKCKEDPVYFINEFARTLDPRGKEESVPFKLYGYQVDFIKQLHKGLKYAEDGKLVDIAVDKSRDMGATWCVVAFCTWAWLFYTGFQCLWGGKKEEDVDDWTVAKIFGKAHFLIDRIPDYLQPLNWNLGKNKEIRRKMKLIHPNGNIIIGESANPQFSRSGRFTMIFMDEYAFWENDREAWTSTGSSTRFRVLVSTPNGYGNTFSAIIHSNENRIHTRMHWRIHPIFGKDSYFDEAQNKWRSPWYDSEVKRRLLGGEGSMKDISQELDCSYTQSGDPAFPSYLLKRHFLKDHEAKPQKYESYAMGVDVSQGLDGIDAQSITVIAKKTGLQTYQWTGKLSAVSLARKVVDVATAYNNCLVAIERNNGGPEIINRVKELGYRNLYHQKTYDKLTEVTTQKIGWWTGNNKPMMVLDFQSALQLGVVKLTDKKTVDEFRKYQVVSAEKNTKYSAPKGHHDDRVMSTMIAWQCLKDVRMPLNEIEQERREFKKQETKAKRYISVTCGY